MRSHRTRRTLATVAVVSLLLALLALFNPMSSFALPQYATATGQPCATCHVNPAGGGARTATGQAFGAVANHATSPAAAFQQISAPAQATPAPAATAKPATTTTAPAATAAPAAATLPKSGDISLGLLAAGALSLLAAGWGARRSSR